MTNMLKRIQKLVNKKNSNSNMRSGTYSGDSAGTYNPLSQRNLENDTIAGDNNTISKEASYMTEKTPKAMSYIDTIKKEQNFIDEELMKKDAEQQIGKTPYEEKFSEKNIKKITDQAQKISDFADKYFEDKNSGKGDEGKQR